MKKIQIHIMPIRQLMRLPVLTVVTFLLVVATIIPNVRADSIQQQIQNLQNQNAANQNAVSQLQGQAVSYQDAINHLNAQIYQLQGEIQANLATQASLQQQIEQKQAQLEEQKKGLGEDLKSMYVNGSMTTVEMLATSQDLSHFVDAETYRGAVQTSIQKTLAQIATIQAQLKSQKDQLVIKQQQQQQQQSQLSTAQAQQSNLLAMNEQQQSSYNAQTQANQAKINDLIAEQARANATTSPGGYYFIRFPGAVSSHDVSINDYPYANAGFGMSTAPGCVDNDGPDRWGYCTRQCVSYAAWAVERSGRTAPTYYGNAKDWISAARSAGIPIFPSDPQPGDVAISTAGTWGHAMYVEKVDGNNIFVSQYNQALTGQYSTQWRQWR